MTLNEDIIEDEIDLLDLIKVIWKNKILILIVTFISLCMAVIINITTKPIYKAEMSFVSEGSSQSSMALAFAANLGINAGGNEKVANYKVILESRTFREEMIKSLNLENKLKELLLEKNKRIEIDKLTIHQLANYFGTMVEIIKDEKSGIYTISTFMTDKELTAKVANDYFEELQNFLEEKSVTKSKRNKEYIGKQLKIVEEKLKNQEESLKNLEKTYNTVSIMDEAKAVSDILAGLKENIIMLTGRLLVEEEFSGKENIEVKRLRKEIQVLGDQIIALQKGSKDAAVKLIPLEDIPDIKIKMTRLQRELKATVEIYQMLLAQYETAKIEEIKDTSLINMLDEAIVPISPEKPNKKLNMIIGIVLGLFLGIFLSFAFEFIKGIEWHKINED